MKQLQDQNGRTTLLVGICVVLFGAPSFAATFEVYLLAGQSNMVGLGQVSELPADYQKPSDDVFIFHGAQQPDGSTVPIAGKWTRLATGHGYQFKFENGRNVYSDRFGVELSLARALQECRPNARIALVKYARGGTSIDMNAEHHFGCWDPEFPEDRGPNQYDHCLAAIRAAFATHDIDGDGVDDQLVPTGIVWMQGESDAYKSESSAKAYLKNLTVLMKLLRAALHDDALPVVVGRISDSGQADDGKVWDYGDLVRAAQADFVASDKHAALVTSTDNYAYSDKYHYDTAGYLDLGKKFAEALCKLQDKTTVPPPAQ